MIQRYDKNILYPIEIRSERKIDVTYIYELIKDQDKLYPNFHIWFWTNVVKNLNGDKKIILELRDKKIAGLAIIKLSEKKICTLRVFDPFKNRGIGIKLFKRCFLELGTNKPLLTVSEDKLPEFEKIFNHFGFSKDAEVMDLYQKGKKEIIYNL